MNAEEIRKTVYNYFTSYWKRTEENEDEEAQEGQESKFQQPNFQTLRQYVDETTAQPEDIVYNLLSSICEERFEVIQEHLPKVVADIIGQQWKLASGISKFVQELSDMCSDSPRAPEWFWQLVLKPMLDNKKFELKMIKWLQPDDDIFALGGHFEVFAYLINHKAQAMGSVAKAIDAVRAECGETLNKMKDKNEEDKEELVARICEVSGLAGESEVFKFLGLSQ